MLQTDPVVRHLTPVLHNTLDGSPLFPNAPRLQGQPQLCTAQHSYASCLGVKPMAVPFPVRAFVRLLNVLYTLGVFCFCSTPDNICVWHVVLHLFLFFCFFCRADNWLSAAVDCLEFLPDQLVVDVSRGLPRCSPDPDDCKRLIYSVLAQHYGETQYPPLLSNHVFDIHSGISELLGKRGVRGGCHYGCLLAFLLVNEAR